MKTLIEHGEAPYQFEEGATASYFVTTKDETGISTVWGVGLKSAIADAGVQLGDQIQLQRIGRENVIVNAPVLDAEGKPTGRFQEKEATRNAWRVESAEEVVKPHAEQRTEPAAAVADRPDYSRAAGPVENMISARQQASTEGVVWLNEDQTMRMAPAGYVESIERSGDWHYDAEATINFKTRDALGFQAAVDRAQPAGRREVVQRWERDQREAIERDAADFFNGRKAELEQAAQRETNEWAANVRCKDLDRHAKMHASLRREKEFVQEQVGRDAMLARNELQRLSSAWKFDVKLSDAMRDKVNLPAHQKTAIEAHLSAMSKTEAKIRDNTGSQAFLKVEKAIGEKLAQLRQQQKAPDTTRAQQQASQRKQAPQQGQQQAQQQRVAKPPEPRARVQTEQKAKQVDSGWKMPAQKVAASPQKANWMQALKQRVSSFAQTGRSGAHQQPGQNPQGSRSMSQRSQASQGKPAPSQNFLESARARVMSFASRLKGTGRQQTSPSMKAAPQPERKQAQPGKRAQNKTLPHVEASKLAAAKPAQAARKPAPTPSQRAQNRTQNAKTAPSTNPAQQAKAPAPPAPRR